MLKIITISGLDGSGKSTQTQMLKNYLEARGRRVYYFHAVEFGIVNKIFKYLKKISNTLLRSEKCVTQEKSVKNASWLPIQMRKLFLWLDLIRFTKLYQNLENEGYDYVLSDRYFYDSLINIFYLEGFIEAKLPDFKKLSFLEPDLAVYLKVDPEIIMRRERIPDQGLEYLKRKELLYSNTSNNWNLVTIDGNRSKEEVFEEIKKALGSRF